MISSTKVFRNFWVEIDDVGYLLQVVRVQYFSISPEGFPLYAGESGFQMFLELIWVKCGSERSCRLGKAEIVVPKKAKQR